METSTKSQRLIELETRMSADRQKYVRHANAGMGFALGCAVQSLAQQIRWNESYSEEFRTRVADTIMEAYALLVRANDLLRD